MFRKLLLAAVLALASGSAFAQNPTCPTRPLGDSTNACASTAFVQQNAGGGGGGYTVCNVKTNGAVGDGVTDDEPAFKACRVALDAASGGIIYAPPGNYCLKTIDANNAAISINSKSITVIGAGINVTSLWTCGTDITIIYANVTGSGIKDLSYIAKGFAWNQPDPTFGATKPAFKFDTSCGLCRISYVRGFGGLYALDNLGFDTFVSDFSFGYTYGNAIYHSAGNGHRVLHGALNQNWPVVLPNQNSLTINAWQANHAYTGNGAANTNVVSTQGYNIQLVSATCTSGSSAPTLQNYNVAITDNTCTWQLVGNTTYYGLHCDGNCAELEVHGEVDLNCGGCTYNFAMKNNNAGNAPSTVVIDGSSVGQAIASQMLLQDGNSFTLVNNHIATNVQSNASAVTVVSPFSGSVSIVGNKFSGPGSAISIGLVPSGISGYTITGNRFDSMTRAINYFGAAGAVHITASNNTMINTSIGFIVPAGSSFYQFTSNDVNGAAVTYTTTDANIAVYGNDGSPVPVQSMAASSLMLIGKVTGVNFNSANSDNAVSITLPPGFTRYNNIQIQISNASASISTATAGLFTATGGGGVQIIPLSPLTVTSNADATNNNAMFLNATNINTQSYTISGFPTLQVRVGTAQGSAATADVTVWGRPTP